MPLGRKSGKSRQRYFRILNHVISNSRAVYISQNESDAARIRELQETIRRNDIQSSMRGEELDRLNELLEERTNKVEEYQLRISTFENIMRPAVRLAYILIEEVDRLITVVL